MTIHPLIVDYLDMITSGSEENVQFRLEEFEVDVNSSLVDRTVGQLKRS